MKLTIPLRTFLLNEKASVRLVNTLTRFRVSRQANGRGHLTLSRFIDQWPLERLRAEVFGFGKKAQAELLEILTRHCSCQTGMRYADYCASLRPPQPERTCVHCGCTDSRACAGGCFWTEKHQATPTGVCSRCVSVVQNGPLRPFRIGAFIFTRLGPKQLLIQSPFGVEGRQVTDDQLHPVIGKFLNRPF